MSSQVSVPPNIPADVSYEILLQSCDEDAAFFWLDCRRVSRNFHSAVENVFAAKYLRQTWIHVYSAGGEPARSRTMHTTESQFLRLDPDVLVTGETGQRHGDAWGHYSIVGRVRPWDGLVVLLQKPADPRNTLLGEWIFKGYIHDQNLVGRWRETTTSADIVGYEGGFIMTKTN